MLTELCAYLRNYFLRDYSDPDAYIHHGTFEVAGGQIQALPFLLPGQYFRVIGSVFNDGVWQYRPGGEAEGMTDETFDGTIWAMQIPPSFLDLADEIESWVADNASALNSPYTSEAFGSGGYSYTKKKGGSSGASGAESYGWEDQFASALKQYRRQSVL